MLHPFKLDLQVLVFKNRLDDLHQALAKLPQDHCLSLGQSEAFLFCLLCSSNEAATCRFYGVERDTRQRTPVKHSDR